MLWLWIPGVLAALILLLCLTRVGAEAAFSEDGGAVVDVRAGLLHIRVFPGKEKPEKKKKPEKEKPEKKAGENLERMKKYLEESQQ